MPTRSGLRRWQAQCIEQASAHFQHHSHFFVQATPGSGKTRMTAELAAQMLEDNRIDFVICFAPSLEIVSGIERTFSRIIENFRGNILNSIGAVFTYQSMEHLSPLLWRTISECRTLVVFDEIHHCAGHNEELSNAWGQSILLHIQDRAIYTLGLSGTPWRSDDLPIALARYSDPEGRLITDYRYGLRSAVRDSVCRVPHITLIDNPEIRMINGIQTRDFSSIIHFLRDTDVTYESILRRDEIIDAILGSGCDRLSELRHEAPSAGGLIVATDIDHAGQVARRLEHLGEDFVVVTNETPNAKQVIDRFRSGVQRWIVAVGMISEGTDIPRLRVCCYLSRIRTELHYRQVLGRILRREGLYDPGAWLYAIAEAKIHDYSNRVADDLPDEHAVLSSVELSKEEESHSLGSALDLHDSNSDITEDVGDLIESGSSETDIAPNPEIRFITFSQYYRQLLLSTI